MIEHIQIQIVYAEPEKFWQQQIQLPLGATVGQALERLDYTQFPATMQMSESRLSVYGQLVKTSEILHEHDRIEILRPLTVDPKEIRRQRAALNPYKKPKKK